MFRCAVVEPQAIDHLIFCLTACHEAHSMQPGAIVGHAGVFVPDRRGEEFGEAARRLVTGLGDDARHEEAVAGGDVEHLGLGFDDLWMLRAPKSVTNVAGAAPEAPRLSRH